MSKKTGTSEGNTTLPVEHENVIFMAILHGGASMSVATKSIWKKMGKAHSEKHPIGRRKAQKPDRNT